jgi:hypothetical protein
MSTTTKYARTYHLPFSPGTTSDDRISKSVESVLNIETVITEKLDGENTGMNDRGVFARSHATFTTSSWSKEVRQLHSLIKNDIGEDMFLFGENMEGIHSIEYTNLRSYFYMFGLRQGSLWASWRDTEELAYLLDLKVVPVLFKGVIKSEKELKDIVEDLVSKPSSLGGLREGVVIRNAESFLDKNFSQNVLKWVRKDHVTTTTHWQKSWVKAKIVGRF